MIIYDLYEKLMFNGRIAYQYEQGNVYCQKVHFLTIIEIQMQQMSHFFRLGKEKWSK